MLTYLHFRFCSLLFPTAENGARNPKMHHLSAVVLEPLLGTVGAVRLSGATLQRWNPGCCTAILEALCLDVSTGRRFFGGCVCPTETFGVRGSACTSNAFRQQNDAARFIPVSPPLIRGGPAVPPRNLSAIQPLWATSSVTSRC